MPVRKIVSSASIILLLMLGSVHVSHGGDQGDQLHKIDPRFRTLLNGQITNVESVPIYLPSVIPVAKDLSGNELYGVVIHTDDPDLLTRGRVPVQSRFRRSVTARLPLSALTQIAELPGVLWIEASTTLHPTLDVSVPATGADRIQDGMVNGTPYKGSGVIVGVIDSGIDWKHLDFRQDADTTQSRILFLWDQTISKTGSEMTPGDRDASLPNFGVEYLQSDINDEIDGSPANFVREMDTNDHGTHVAGIAAGDGSSSADDFVGVAPEADLIIVKAGNGTFQSVDVIDALAYINKKATDLGMPVVMNLSLGGHEGAHDGSRGDEIVLDDLLGTPGKVAVVAAGNDGGTLIHAGGTVTQGGTNFAEFEIPSYAPNSGTNNDFVLLDMWYEGGDALSVSVMTPGGTTFTRGAGEFGGVETSSDEGAIFIDNSAAINPINGGKNAIIQVFDLTATKPPAAGTWRITVGGTSVAVGGRYDIWLYSQTMEGAEFASGGDESRIVAMPGTSVEAITVASYVTKISWKSIDTNTYTFSPAGTPGAISDFSSGGPTRDGRQKPDIAAPGEGIVAGLSKDASPLTAFIVEDGKHMIQLGTSQASPHVAGTAALLLQINPGLTADQVKDAITSTANSDANTGTVPNSRWGFGKLDAFAAANSVVTSVERIPSEIPARFSLGQNYPNPFNPSTTIEFKLPREEAVELQIFNVMGEEVARVIDNQRMGPGHFRVRWNALSSSGMPLSSGVYFYQLDAGDYSGQAKMVLVR